ncbi:MAG: adenylate/guanylate cyclase domain-containing protein [Sphaerospermopsis sp. SIO1G2]|nr:adenylate/guanylate cyclase domain-containing protein [Sphaerospermopsis sp. SIO1G2]
MDIEKLKNVLWQGQSLWTTTPLITLAVILIRFTGLLQSWEWGVFDQYMRWRPSEQSDNRIVIVGIDEQDLENLQQANISDQVLAELLNKLKSRQPRAIGLDIYRNLPSPPGTPALEQVYETTPNLIGIQKVVGESHERVKPPPILEEKGQVGANDLLVDADNKVRRGLFYINPTEETIIYSFSLYLALLYLDQEGISATDDFQIGKAKFQAFESNDGGYVRADSGGYQILINYLGRPGHFDVVSMTDILEDKVPQEWGRDRIILVGYIGESFKDSFMTPYSSDLLSLPEPMSGVEIHGHIVSQILQAATNNRPLFQSWSEWEEWLWILMWSTVGATLTWKLQSYNLLPIQRIIFILIATGILFAITYLVFLYGWWLPVVPSFLALTGSTAAITAYFAHTAGEIRKIFGRYINDEVVSTILESPEGLKLGGERKKITIFTSDLRGFTATSERLPPEEVVKILNFYLECMADEITKYQGTIDEFMGDGILVLFGAPTARKDDAARAVACAIAMQLAMVKVNAQMKEWKLPPLEMGIGINTGVVVVGNIGSEKRTKYGVVGNQVNLTYRIESYTTGGEIIISEATYQEVKSIVLVDDVMKVTPKGVKGATNVYKIAGIESDHNLFLPKIEEKLCHLSESVVIEYVVVDGKDVGNTFVKGTVIKLSNRDAEICLVEHIQEPPSRLSNIKINLCHPQAEGENEDIYAKVLDKECQSGHFYIRFTAKPPAVVKRFNNLMKNSQDHQSPL